MTIETMFGNVGSLGGVRPNTPETKIANNPFADHFKEQMTKAKNAASVQENQRTNKFAGDIAAIKEKGLTAYIRDLQVEKLEELRKEILETMGITEEDLQNMTPEQRASIEKIVEEEIQKRLAAMTIMEKENGEDVDQEVLEQIMPGMGTSYALLSAMEDTRGTDPFSITQGEEEG